MYAGRNELFALHTIVSRYNQTVRGGQYLKYLYLVFGI